MKSEYDVKERLAEVGSLRMGCHAADVVVAYLYGYCDALEWVLEGDGD